MDTDRIKEKIRKMLAIAENDAASQGEIENAVRLAQEAMLAHNLSREDITHNGNAQERTRGVQYGSAHAYSYGSQRTAWESALAAFLCKFIGTVQWYYETRVSRRNHAGLIDQFKPNATQFTFYGPDQDCELVVDLFNEIQLAVVATARLLHGSHTRGEGASYCQGFIRGLEEANRKAEKALEYGDDHTRALILVSKENAVAIRVHASQWLRDEQGIRLSGGARLQGAQTGFSTKAFNQGRRDGAAYDVSAQSKLKLET